MIREENGWPPGHHPDDHPKSAPASAVDQPPSPEVPSGKSVTRDAGKRPAAQAYPPNWPEISKAIRFGRADGQCECEGECGAGHDGRCEARHNQPHPVTGSKVVLTTAHRDQEPRNCAPENLFAACQRCHLWYDRDQHRANAAWTRAGRPDVQLELFGPGAAA